MKYEKRRKKFAELRQILVTIVIFCSVISTATANKKYTNNLDKLNKKLGVHEKSTTSFFPSTVAALTVANACSEFQFQCRSDGFCIPAQWKCDFVNDCKDGSDENTTDCEMTSIVQNECDNDDFFHCNFSRKCIPKEWVCDEVNDCGLIGKFNLLDDSDEKQKCTPKCPTNKLACANGVCLHISKFCDGHVDCPNDEFACADKTACKSLKCDYECKSTPYGARCYCPPNQSIVNGTKCVVQRECLESTSEDGEICDQVCVNSKGRNKCSCANGFERINHKCYGINEPPTKATLLFLLTPEQIYKIILPSERSFSIPDSDEVENSSPVTLTQVLKLKNVITMEVNFLNHTVCVMENFDIFCYNASNFLDKWKMPAPDFLPLYQSPSNVLISHFALDWLSRNWYFMDVINNFIFVCSHEMKNCRIIIRAAPQGDSIKFKAFAIDPSAGFLFLTKFNLQNRTNARLARFTLDGMNEVSLIKGKIFYPHELTLDTALKRIYFLDHHFDFIQQCDYDGGNRKFLQNMPLMKFHRIAFFENNFFGAVTQKNSSIVQISKSSSSFKKVLAENLKENTKMMKIFHQQTQPSHAGKSKVCAANNKCEHLCVPVVDANSSKVMEKCLCKEGFIALESGKCSLKDSSKFIMFVEENPRILKAVETDNLMEQAISPIVGFKSNIAYDVDLNNKLIYYTSYADSYVILNNSIEYRSFNGSISGKLRGEFGNVHSIAYDWIGNNLFISSSNPNYKISVMKLSLKSDEMPVIKTLVNKNFVGPSTIALDVEHGYLFWTSFAERYHVGGKIEMSRMDGAYRETLASKNVNGNSSIYWPVSLTYCKESRTLFWLDVLSQSIDSINLDSKVRVQRKLEHSYAQSMTILSNEVYWTDNLKGNIHAINIDSTKFNKDFRVFYKSPSKKSFMKSANIDLYFDHVETETQMKCPGLWLNTPNKGICVCGDGFSKNAMGSACIPSPSIETTSMRNTFKCSPNSFTCKTGDECIDNHAMVCDGNRDCTDGSDEEETPDGPCPKRCDYKCGDGICINSHQVCDGIKDCNDESDETVSVCKNKTDQTSDDYMGLYDYCDEFLCDNSNCVMLESRCDGVNDCDDDSDEKDCPIIPSSTTAVPSSTPFDDIFSEDNEEVEETDYNVSESDCHAPDSYCEANHRCIPVHQLCDGISQCSDKSDEAGRCSERLCDHFSECQFFCHNAPNPDGFVCSCPQHMSLNADGRTCLEAQTCDEFTTCSHTCIQLNPSKVKCKCQHGYHLKADNFSCESDHPHEPILLISNRHILRGIHLNSRESKNYYSMSKNLIGLDFYYDRHSNAYEIVWSDITRDKIYLGKLRGDELTNIKSIVESDLSTTESVAIDWIGKNIYWIDASLKQIDVATKDGLHRTTLISENMTKPRSLALDPRLGFLFWSDWEDIDPRIERASLAGEDRKSIFGLKSLGGSWPNGITLDYVKRRIYFLDAKTREIHTIGYNGENHKRLIKNPEFLHHPYAVTIYENNLFWTDWRLSSVITADKFTGFNITIFYQSSIQPFDVKVMHPSRQPWDYNAEGSGKEIISPCENSSCSHLCLLSTNNCYKCACPHMMRISDINDKICEKVKDILLYITDKSEIRAIEINFPNSTAISTIYHTSQIIMPSHIAIHPKEKIIYWSDVHLREIKSVKLSTSITPTDKKIETILDADIDNVHGFAVDYNSGLLYFSQKIPEEEEREGGGGGHRLMLSNMKGEFLTKLLDDVNVIYSIIVASDSRKLFYIMISDTKHYEVRQCNMDGSEDALLFKEDEVIQSLAYDGLTKRLYFIKNYRKIFYCDLRSSALKLVNTFYGEKGLGHAEYVDLFITSLEVFGDFIFFSENSTSSIRKCDKTICREPEMYRKNTPNVKQLKIMALSDAADDSSDINGCLYEGGRKCEHLCIPIGFSGFVCKCAIGYTMDPKDSSKCIGQDDFLVYSLGYELKGIGSDNQTKQQAFFTPIQCVNVISTFDFDAPHDLIYFSDNERGEIGRIKKDGSARQTILSSLDFDQSNSDWLGGIAVDWVAQNIYWTDQKRGLIEVARHDGTFRRVLISQLSRPRKIHVDPLLGMLFFSTSESEIYSMSLDSTNLFRVLKKQIAAFNDFVIDTENQVIYYCEAKQNKIWRIDYDGNQRKELLIENVNNPVSLDIIDKTLYWAERGVGNIKSVHVEDLENVRTLKSTLSNQLKNLKIFSTRKQKGTNLCAMPTYGGCDELCYYDGSKANCFCSHGYLDSDDNKTCRKYENKLFISRRESIERINLDGDKNSSLILSHNHHLQNVVALAYDFKRHLIYYSDVKLNAICVCDFTGQTFVKLITDQAIVEGLAFDPQNRHLFWTLNGEAEIRSFDLNKLDDGTITNLDFQNSVTKILSLKKGHDKLRAVVVEPCLNMLYYSNWNNKFPSISRIYVSGYGREDIITTEIVVPNALTIDLNDKKLFWADARLDKIERCDYDGKNRVVLAQAALKHPFSIAVFEDYVFWSDWTLHAVVRANKYSGNDVVFVSSAIEHPMGIVVAQDELRNCSNGLCDMFNGGCEDKCLPLGSKSFKCECTQGTLAKDNRRCLLRNKTSSCNATHEFQCKTGECIPITVTCDGIPHCIDNSDESVTYCALRSCSADDYFQCRNFKCIHKNEKCDGTSQCGDGSDEENCECPDDKFRCRSGECIDKSMRCDYDPDCRDASDEMGCEARDCSVNRDMGLVDMGNYGDSLIISSSRRLIPCPYTTACYMKEWECDGENDCWDGSDEKNCTDRKINNATCPPHQFRCSNGQCIPMEWVCDTEPDCQDGSSTDPSSDEKNCQHHCSSDRFSCDNKSLCIPLSWVCDDIMDCNDKSDENQCANKTKIQEPVTCQSYQATCLNGECISKSEWCDGSFDCKDSSDESEACLLTTNSNEDDNDSMKKCNETEFTCKSDKHCVPLTSICDLKSDCNDESDENATMCENYPLYCEKNPLKFLCNSGGCIDDNLTCDGLNDCSDFSDEELCNVNECEHVDCEQNCHDLKIGYKCSCNSGFKVNENNTHECDDINECEDRPCSQLCLNTYGSYHCECLEGYARENNRCKIDSPEHPKIIFSNRFYIRSVSLDGHADLLLHNLSNAVAIDFDWSRKFIYFSDVTVLKSEIIRMKWDGSANMSGSREVIHQQNLKNPDGIGFDWVARNLYWCDKGRKTIEVSKDNGYYRKLLIDEKLDEPRAIALDPYRKYLYWTDWGKIPHVGRAGMDGSDKKYIVTGNLGWPNALTISFETNELFFGDAREDFISVCDLDGSNRKVVAHRKYNPNINLHHIFSIAVWEDRVYFSDWESKSIEYCDKYTGKNCGTLIKLIHRPMDLRIFHPIRQQRLKTSSSYENLMRRKSDVKSNKKKFDKTTNIKDNPCANSNCSALCLLSPIAPYYKCACPDYFYLADDQKTCVANCTAAQFHCKKSMKCIPFFWKCDGQQDCEFKEDEPDNCGEFKCEPGQFQCDLKSVKTNVTCLDAAQICDGTKQCVDGADEDNCEKYGCFIDTYFQCEKHENSSAFCIPKSKVCNGKIDCPSGNDERNCSRSCTAAQFKCESRDLCIPKVWECDGDADCIDGSDERNCTDRTCFAIEFRCNSGRCIPPYWQCDAESDCPGGEDEKGCEAAPVNKTCEPTYFRCNRTGKCIPGRWRCDHKFDCDDFSDEDGCPPRECSESEFKCNDGRCIKGSLRCNKEYNCFDFSDEFNCTANCDESLMFKCSNQNQCIDKSLLCDGEPDCDDYSDEKNCECSRNEFKCSGEYSKCILNDWICDGVIDCPDKSDEHDSRCLSRGCVGHSNKCANGKCVPGYFYCDGVDHCGDGSDERNCNTKKTDTTDTKIGCKFGSCSQLCLEKGSKGSIQCKCANGYHKTGSMRNATCKATEGQHLIFTASESEFRFIFTLDYGAPELPPRGRSRSTREVDKKIIGTIHSYIKTNSSKITSFDFVINDDKDIILFWLDSPPTNNLQRIKLNTENDFEDVHDSGFDGTNSKVLTENKQKNSLLKSLSVDWVTRKIYLIDNDMIKTVDFEGNNPRTLVDGGINSFDVIVDPESRKMFWSTMMRSIYTASMDGSQKKRLVYENIEFASGLAIDYPSRRLYWCDVRKSTIESVTLDGKDRQIVRKFDGINPVTQLLVSPVKLDIYEDDLYVTMANQTIYKLSKFGWKNEFEELNSGPYHFKASQIKIVHTFKHNSSLPNPCLLYPCDGTAICYLSSIEQHGRSCNCPDNLYIQKNGTHVSCLHRTEIPSLCYKPCVNGGKCKYVSDIEMKCECPPQFEGEHCEHFICSEFCYNHGTCTYPRITPTTTTAELKNKRTCTCKTEFKGPRCEIPASICGRDICHNGGTCQYQILKNGTITETCSCPANFSGNRCEFCDSIQCNNDGICYEENDKFRCRCSENRYSGQHCEIDRCRDHCHGHGRCYIGELGPMCECDEGFKGDQCEQDKRPCENCPTVMPNCDFVCQNGGSCRKEITGAESCICVGQWTGANCDLPPRCIDDICGKCNESSSINECLCGEELAQPCTISNDYPQAHNPDVQVSEMFNNDHQTLSVVVILTFSFILMSTLAVIAVFYVRRWQRRVRFFAHARLNENVEEITNPIFDFSATDRDDINLPVTNISSGDDKGHFSNPLYESMYSSSHKGLLEKKSDDEEESKNELL